MAIVLTELSGIALDTILYGHMTPQMAAAYLREGQISVRSFSRTLTEMYPYQDIAQRLTDLYLVIDPNTNLRSLTKKLQNWLSDRNQPSDRLDYFRIAFALQLSEAQLDMLLGLSTDYGIQYRSSRELVLTWFLRNGYGYREGMEFYSTLPPAKECDWLLEGMTSRITHELQSEFQSLPTLADLRNAYLRNLERFGELHLRAYFYFDRFLDQLIHPAPLFCEGEQDYSIEAVMKNYLSLNMPSGRKRLNYSLVQKLIKQNWPNATAIKNIRNHVEDVPRKLLLLLYVVTDNGASDAYRESDEDYVSLEDRVQDHWWTLNAMLADCGMAALDMRNAFDWLILYAIAADPEEAMSERLEQVIKELYG